MRRMIAELNRGYAPQLIVLDGVAADAVGLAMLKSLGANKAIMSRGIFEQEQIARAVDLRLGATGPNDIDIVTGDADSRACAETLRTILAQG